MGDTATQQRRDDDGWLLLSEKGCWRSTLKMINLIRKSTQIGSTKEEEEEAGTDA